MHDCGSVVDVALLKPWPLVVEFAEPPEITDADLICLMRGSSLTPRSLRANGPAQETKVANQRASKVIEVCGKAGISARGTEGRDRTARTFIVGDN